MKKMVGARELKIRLGTYLRQVQKGLTLVVTQRGRPVAELRPLSVENVNEGERLDELVAFGLLSRKSKDPLPAFDPVRSKGKRISQVIVEDREDRL
jgi:prevent-host-death family protein